MNSTLTISVAPLARRAFRFDLSRNAVRRVDSRPSESAVWRRSYPRLAGRVRAVCGPDRFAAAGQQRIL